MHAWLQSPRASRHFACATAPYTERGVTAQYNIDHGAPEYRLISRRATKLPRHDLKALPTPAFRHSRTYFGKTRARPTYITSLLLMKFDQRLIIARRGHRNLRPTRCCAKVAAQVAGALAAPLFVLVERVLSMK